MPFTLLNALIVFVLAINVIQAQSIDPTFKAEIKDFGFYVPVDDLDFQEDDEIVASGNFYDYRDIRPGGPVTMKCRCFACAIGGSVDQESALRPTGFFTHLWFVLNDGESRVWILGFACGSLLPFR